MNNVNYLCCPSCHGWYREGDAHTCDFDHPDSIDRAAPPGILFMRQTFDPPIVSSDENPTVIHTEIQGDFSDTERLYTLLERIATALERLVEK